MSGDGNDLRQMLRASVQEAPHDPLRIDDVLDGGHRRVMRRRALVGAGAVAAVLAVTGSSLVAAELLSGDDQTAPANEPAPVIALSEAVDAVEGSDYTVVTSLPSSEAEVWGITPDGRLVVTENSVGVGSITWQLFDPAPSRSMSSDRPVSCSWAPPTARWSSRASPWPASRATTP